MPGRPTGDPPVPAALLVGALARAEADLENLRAQLSEAERQVATMRVQLREAGKLASLGQLVAGVAHELNNPLTSVVGYAQLIERALSGPPGRAVDSAALSADVAHIVAESERAARIVRTLLLFARRQSTPRALQDLGYLTGQVLEMRAHEHTLLGIDVSLTIADDVPPVFADRSQLQQALLNLLLNAEQAMAGRPRRRLELAVRADPAARAVLVSLCDSGHGIAPAHLALVFDPFFTTRSTGGTGLGLSIVQGIVRDHGGEVWAESVHGEGAAFFVRLPARRPDWAWPAFVVVGLEDSAARDFADAALHSWGVDTRPCRTVGDLLQAVADAPEASRLVDTRGLAALEAAAGLAASPTMVCAGWPTLADIAAALARPASGGPGR